MRTGRVKWFSLRKGYGFILEEETGEDVFIHITELQKSGIGFLVPGKKVGFGICRDRGGGRLMASHIVLR